MPLIQGLPDQWNKLLTKSAITREDYQKDPQAVLDVLEFYTDHQKQREIEEAMAMGKSVLIIINNDLSSIHSSFSVWWYRPRRIHIQRWQ